MPHPFQLGPTGDPGTEVRLEQDGSVIRRSVLPGGIRVLTEAMPAQRSTTVGAWVAVGSRDETDGHHGSTHFLEHLLFKGTRRRSALDIAEAFDAVGGEANAATGKEHTCYYARVLDADLPMAIDVITDMVTSAVIDAGEFETERTVILEELAMAGDDPVDVAHEQFATAVLGPHPLGRPIGGTPETIRQVPREAVLDHYRRTYTPAELVVTAAGAVDHDDVVAQVLDAVRQGGWRLEPEAVPVPRRAPAHALGASRDQDGSPVVASRDGDVPAGPVDAAKGALVLPAVPALPSHGRSLTIRRSTEQANVIVGGPGLTAGDERRWVLSVLTTALGGGMSSRLFQEIRERRGLAYATYSFTSSYVEAGLMGLYAGCAPARTVEVAELMISELRAMAAESMPAEELARTIGQLRGGLVLGLEDPGSRMNRLGRAEIVYGEYLTVDESLSRLEAVTAEDVRALAAELVSSPMSVVVVGPFETDVATQIAVSGWGEHARTA